MSKFNSTGFDFTSRESSIFLLFVLLETSSHLFKPSDWMDNFPPVSGSGQLYHSGFAQKGHDCNF